MTRLLLVLVLIGTAVGLTLHANAPARLDFDESVPDDLRALAEATWHDFVDAHPARASCLSSATLHAAWQLDTRGEYRPSSTTIVVRVPGTPATLRSELVHEFAHHLEFTCDDHAGLRRDFLESQGLPATTDWFEGASWETTPSEQYAEATVELVLGRRSHHGNIHISPRTLEVVHAWAAGL